MVVGIAGGAADDPLAVAEGLSDRKENPLEAGGNALAGASSVIVGIIVSSTTAAGDSASEVAGVIVGFIKSNPDEEGAVIVDEGGFVAI